MMKRIAFVLAISLCAVAWLYQFRATAQPKPAVTFNKHIAPIFFKRCAECHRPGEAAPFSVLSYKDVRPWAKSIKEKVVSRAMPPWHAAAHAGEWANDPRLSQAEIEQITAWVEGGTREGAETDLPPLPQFTAGWRIGQPDLVIPMPETFKLEAKGPDEYQYFEVDPGFKQDTFVQQAEARPGNRRIVHHIIVFIKPPTGDAAEPKPSQAVTMMLVHCRMAGPGCNAMAMTMRAKSCGSRPMRPARRLTVCRWARPSKCPLGQSCCFKSITQKRWAANKLTAHPSDWFSPSSHLPNSRRTKNCWYAPFTTNTSAFRQARPNIA
ncbi:MAG: cytochrome c [Acidobacteria bacterium]|nr:cytochrome c [Acidobacteriota bacterium]